MRKLAVLLGLLCFGIPTQLPATTIPFVGGPTNPSVCSGEMGATECVNSFIGGVLNSHLAGQVAALPAPFVAAATTAQTFLAYTLQANALASGQVIRVTAWGVNGGSASTDTFTLNFGTSAATVAVTGTSAAWRVQCDIQNTGTAASANQSIDCWGKQGTTLVAASQPSSTQALTAAINITLQSTNSVASQMTTNGAYIEIVQ